MISKEDFLAVYNKHLPNKFTQFIYKINAGTDATKDTIKNRIIYGLLTLFLIGFFSTILNAPSMLIKIITIIFSVIISAVVFASLVAFLMNQFRIKRIMRDLDIKDTDDYNKLVNSYIK